MIASFLCFLVSVTIKVNSLDVEKEKRAEEIHKLYNFSAAKKQDAVGDAINFLLQQEDELKRLESLPESSSVSPSDSTKYQKDADGELPTCIVSFDTLLSQSYYEYLGDDVTPPYDYRCWAFRSRYHVAPVCSEEEKSQKRKELFQWKWTVKDAVDGKCKMPDLDPPSVAAEYLNRQKSKGKHGRTVTQKSKFKEDNKKSLNVIMLGLSFMGEPFQSLGCLYEKYLTDNGFVTTCSVSENDLLKLDKDERRKKHNFPTIGEIRKNGMQCTGFDKPNIIDWFPPKLHPNTKIPDQADFHCNLEHSMMEFGLNNTSSEEQIYLHKNDTIMRVCYQYSFNLQKNLKSGTPLPCEWDWSDIDVILTLHGINEMRNIFIPRHNGKPDMLSHLKIVSVGRLYQALHEKKLLNAHERLNFKMNSLKAKPKNCEIPDVHYRLPGIPDFAVQSWLALIATGLHDFNSCRPGHPCFQFRHQIGKIEFWE